MAWEKTSSMKFPETHIYEKEKNIHIKKCLNKAKKILNWKNVALSLCQYQFKLEPLLKDSLKCFIQK